MTRAFVGVVLGLCVGGCGSSSSAPSPATASTQTVTPAPAASVTYKVTGTVSDRQSSRGIASAVVQVVDGTDANKAAVTAADGTFSLANLTPADITLKVTASGYSPLTQTISLTTDKRFDASLQAATRTITGHVTDQTSGGVLPKILISVIDGVSAGLSTQTNGNGDYTLAGVSSDGFGLSASATSYNKVSWTLPAGGDAVQNFVLARDTSSTTTPPPAPTPTPTPAGSIVIGFSRLLALPYSESGYSVVSTLAGWFSAGYGSPGPSLQFSTGAGVTTEGEVRITAAGSTFRFSSVDVYSSTTPIPYVFTGMLSSTVVFAVTGRQGNTFGNFVTVANPQSSAVIDTLLIHLSNQAAPCCSNPMGIDNVVMR